jgi:hypothetical protein
VEFCLGLGDEAGERAGVCACRAVAVAVAALADKGDFEHPIMELSASAVASRGKRMLKGLPTKHGAYQLIVRQRAFV